MARAESAVHRYTYRWICLSVLSLTVVLALAVLQARGPEGLVRLGQISGTSILLLGKFVIFFGVAEESSFAPWQLGLLMLLVDLWIALGLASWIGSIERWRVFGAWLRRARRRAVGVLRAYPGLERHAFFGVVLFVMLPLAATGAVSGSFAWRLLGLSRIAGVSAVAAGSLGTCVLFSALAHVLGERAEQILRSPVLAAVILVALVVLGRTAYVRIVQRLRKPG